MLRVRKTCDDERSGEGAWQDGSPTDETLAQPQVMNDTSTSPYSLHSAEVLYYPKYSYCSLMQGHKPAEGEYFALYQQSSLCMLLQSRV